MLLSNRYQASYNCRFLGGFTILGTSVALRLIFKHPNYIVFLQLRVRLVSELSLIRVCLLCWDYGF
jgi:hypothetical protein